MKATLLHPIRRAAPLALVLTAAAILQGCSSSKPVAAESAPKPVLTFEDQITLDNGEVRLGVSPSIGRVVEFGFSDGPNLIWINTEAVYDDPVAGVAVTDQQYYNLGGDKLWPTAQPLWKLATGNNNWPPDGVIDGGPWSVRRQSENSVTIESAPSPHYGIVVLRTFTLVPDKPRVVIQNLIHRIEPPRAGIGLDDHPSQASARSGPRYRPRRPRPFAACAPAHG